MFLLLLPNETGFFDVFFMYRVELAVCGNSVAAHRPDLLMVCKREEKVKIEG